MGKESRFDSGEFFKALESIQSLLEKDLKAYIDREIASYRQSRIVRDAWCCNNMKEFAREEYSLPKPKSENPFGVSLSWSGKNIIYCPFCGVKL